MPNLSIFCFSTSQSGGRTRKSTQPDDQHDVNGGSEYSVLSLYKAFFSTKMRWKVSRILNWPVVAIPKNEVVGDVFVAMYRQSCCRCSRLFSGIVHDHYSVWCSLHVCFGELCKPSFVDGRTVNVSRWFDHRSLFAGCFHCGIPRDKKRKTNVKMHTEEQQVTLFWTEHMHTSLHPRDYVCRSKPS